MSDPDQVCKYDESKVVEAVTQKKNETSNQNTFKNLKVWLIVMGVYVAVFGYIGTIAFWPMSFNDPDQTVEKYFAIVNKHDNKFKTEEDRKHYRAIITELIKESESEADDMQELASQSFNIVLGAFLAFLSATVTTIFQGNRK